MKTHEIVLEGYEARCDGILVLGTEDSFGTEHLHVTLGEDWEELTLTAVFTNMTSTEVIMNDDGMIAVPAEAVAESTGESFGRIVFKGTADGVQRVSGDVLYIALPHGPAAGENSAEPTPDQFSQFVGMVAAEADRAEEAAERAEEASRSVNEDIVKQAVTEYLDENPVQPTSIDTTLTQADEAADAKAVGDALAALDQAKQPAGEYLTEESDPTVPDWAKAEQKPAYTFSEVGAAPAGFGYGDKMDYLDVQDGTFETVLDEILTGMDACSAKQIQFYDTEGLYANKFIGNLWKYTANYAVLEAVSYSGLKAVKRKTGGTWMPWEWENPPMVPGTEYCTAQRYNGKIVYAKCVDIGTLPASGQKVVSYSTAAVYPVEFKAFVTTASGYVNDMPFFTAAGTQMCKGYCTNNSVIVQAYADCSASTGYAYVYYTKE